MLIFLHGPDTFRSRRKLNEIIEQYKKANSIGLSLNFIDFKEKDFVDFKNAVETVSMFNEKKLVILRNLFGDKKNIQEKFLDYLDKIKKDKDSVVAVYETGEIDKNSSLFKSLCLKPAMSQEFNLLAGQKLIEEAKQMFLSAKTDIAPRALEKLVFYVGNDLWRMSQEIEKLINYKGGVAIEEKDIDLLIKPKISSDIFATIDALAERKKATALQLIFRHLEKGDDPFYIFSMLAYQIRNLLNVKSLVEKGVAYWDLAKTLKLHPFVVKKTFCQIKKFSLPELKKIHHSLFEADLAMKTGKIDGRLAIERLIMDI